MYVFMAVAVLVSTVQACEYNNPEHTTCKYTSTTCKPISRGMTAASRTQVVNVHNTYRQQVASGKQAGQPGSSNMKEMSYDSESEKIAQIWADQCKFGHDSVRNTKNFSYVGQNVAITMSSAAGCTADFSKATKMWYDEVTKPGFDSKKIKPFEFDYGAGHYTQVVWADSYKIGCGFSCYKEGNWYKQLYVCNYGPGGNMQKAAMYETGTGASKCPTGTKKSTTYNALCV